MERRTNNRIPSNQEIILSSDNSRRLGTITNCSEKGMYIKTIISFPFDSIYEVLIPLKEEILKVPVKVVRIAKTDRIYEGIGVELLKLPENYLKFLVKLSLNY